VWSKLAVNPPKYAPYNNTFSTELNAYVKSQIWQRKIVAVSISVDIVVDKRNIKINLDRSCDRQVEIKARGDRALS
jgi:hypothetical protein